MPTLLAPLPPALDAPGRAEALAALCARHGVRALALFGSATGDRFDPARSDLDVLFDFERGGTPNPEAVAALQAALEGLFGRPVDLLTSNGLENPYFRRQVLSDILPLYRTDANGAMAGLRARKLIWDAVRALDRAIGFMAGHTGAAYAADPVLQSAVERQLITVGEALSVLRREAPDVAALVPRLAEVVGLRHRLVHGYEEVDPGAVWLAVTQHAPTLRDALREQQTRLDAEG